MATKTKRAAESWPYVLLSDRQLPPEAQSTFSLRPLTISERARANDMLASTFVGADGSKERIARSRTVALHLAVQNIESVENFPAGEPKPWPKDNAERLAYLELLGDDNVDEIGNEIFTRSFIEDAAKNS